MKNKAIIIPAIVLGVLILAYAYTNTPKSIPKNTLEQAGWQTYTAPTLGYGFQYPSTWVLLGDDEHDVHIASTVLDGSNSSEYGVAQGVSSVEVQSVVYPTSVTLLQAFKEYTNYSNDLDGMHA